MAMPDPTSSSRRARPGAPDRIIVSGLVVEFIETPAAAGDHVEFVETRAEDVGITIDAAAT